MEGKNADFLLAVEIGQLTHLEALAKHLQTIRDAAKAPIEMQVNVTAPGLDKVTQGINALRRQGALGGANAGLGGGERSDTMNRLAKSIDTLAAQVRKTLGKKDTRENLPSLELDTRGLVEAINGLGDRLEATLLSGRAPRVSTKDSGVIEQAQRRRASPFYGADLQQLLSISRDPSTSPVVKSEVDRELLSYLRRGARTEEKLRRESERRQRHERELERLFPEISEVYSRAREGKPQGARAALLDAGYVGFSAGDAGLKRLGIGTAAAATVGKQVVTDLQARIEDLRKRAGRPVDTSALDKKIAEEARAVDEIRARLASLAGVKGAVQDPFNAGRFTNVQQLRPKFEEQLALREARKTRFVNERTALEDQSLTKAKQRESLASKLQEQVDFIQTSIADSLSLDVVLPKEYITGLPKQARKFKDAVDQIANELEAVPKDKRTEGVADRLRVLQEASSKNPLLARYVGLYRSNEEVSEQARLKAEVEARAAAVQKLEGTLGLAAFSRIRQRRTDLAKVTEDLAGAKEARRGVRRRDFPEEADKYDKQIKSLEVKKARLEAQVARPSKPRTAFENNERLLKEAREELEASKNRLLENQRSGGLLDPTSPASLREAGLRAARLSREVRPLADIARTYTAPDVADAFPTVNPLDAVRLGASGAVDKAAASAEVQIQKALRQGFSYQPFGDFQIQQIEDAIQTLEESRRAAVAQGDKAGVNQLSGRIAGLTASLRQGGEWWQSRFGRDQFPGFRTLEGIRDVPSRSTLSDAERAQLSEQSGRLGYRDPNLITAVNAFSGKPSATHTELVSLLNSLSHIDLSGAASDMQGFVREFAGLRRELRLGGAGTEVFRAAHKRLLIEAQSAADKLRSEQKKSEEDNRSDRRKEEIRLRGEEVRANALFRSQLPGKPRQGRLAGAASAISSVADRLGIPGLLSASAGRGEQGTMRRIRQLLGEVDRLEGAVETGYRAFQSAQLPEIKSRLASRQVDKVNALDVRRDLLSASITDLLGSPSASLERQLADFESRREQGLLGDLQPLTSGSSLKQLVQDRDVAASRFSELRNLRERFAEADARRELVVDPTRPLQGRVGRTRDDVAKARQARNAANAEAARLGYTGDKQAIISQLDTDIGSARGDVDALTGALTRQTQAFSEYSRQVSTASQFVDGFIRKGRTLLQYFGVSFVIYGLAQQVSRLTREVVDLESELAKIQGIFPNRGQADIQLIEEGAIRAANDYGTSIREVVQLTKSFAQLGLNPEAALKETRATLLGVRGAGLDPQQAVESLIAVRNLSGGRVSSEDILDRISRIEARNAVSSQDLSVAIQRVGSLATQMQPERLGFVDAFDTVIGATTQIVEATRVTGNQAATSLRFILARLTAPEIANKLQGRFGIRLATSEGGAELRPLLDILSDIADRFNTLTAEGRTVEASQLVQTVAGQRQANAAVALFSGFDKVLETARASSTAFGDTQARLALQQNTTRFKLEQFDTAVVTLANHALRGSGALGIFNAALGGVTDLLNKLAGDRAGSSATLGAGVLSSIVTLGLGLGARKLGKLKDLAPVAGAAADGAAAAGARAGIAGTALVQGLSAVSARIAPILLGFSQLTVVLTGLSLIVASVRKLIGKSEDDERFGPAEVSRDAILKSQVGTRFSESAAQLGTTTAGLKSVIDAAVEAARARVQETFGTDVFGAQTRIAPDDERFRGSREVFQTTFVESLSNVLPALRNIEDPATRASTALDLLRTSAQLASGSLDIQSNRLRTNIEEYLQRVQQTLSDPKKLTPSRGGLPATGAFGNATAGNPIASPSDLLNRIFEDPQGNVVGSLRKLPFNFLGELQNAMNAEARKFPQALSEVVDKFLLVPDKYREAVEEAARRIDAKYPLGGADLKTRLLSQEFAGRPEIQGPIENQAAFQKALREGLEQRFRINDVIAASRQGAQDLFPSGGGGSGQQFIQEQLRKVFDEILTKLQSAGQTPEVQQTTEAVKRLSQSNLATRGFAQLPQTSRVRVGRDYTLEALSGFLKQQDEIEFGRTQLRALGTSFDVEQERANASRDLLKSLSGVRARVEGDLLQALNRYVEIPGAAGLSQLEGTETNEVILNQAIEGAMAATERTGVGSDRQRAETQIKLITDALQELTNNTPLLGELGKDFREQLELLNERIQQAAADNNLDLATLTYEQIVAAARKQARRQQSVLDTRRARELESEFVRGRETEGLSLAQGLRDIGLERTLRQQALVVGGSDLNVRLGQTALTGRARVEQAVLRARQETERAYEQARAGGSEQQLQQALTQAKNTLALDQLRAVNEEQLSVDRTLMEQTAALAKQRQEATTGLSRSALGGVRDVLSGGYRSLVGDGRTEISGRQVAERVLVPFADTITSRLADNLVESLIGPTGVFGGLNTIFAQNLFQEQELLRQERELQRVEIRQGAKEGIIEGMRQNPFAAPADANEIFAAAPRPTSLRSFTKATNPEAAASLAAAAVSAAAVAGQVVIPKFAPDQPGVVSSAFRNNNPGNLRFAYQKGARPGEGGFAAFPTPEAGAEALRRQVLLDSARGDTIRTFLEEYAPKTENDTESYIKYLSKSLGVTENTRLDTLDPDLIAEYVARRESGSSLGRRRVTTVTQAEDDRKAIAALRTLAGGGTLPRVTTTVAGIDASGLQLASTPSVDPIASGLSQLAKLTGKTAAKGSRKEQFKQNAQNFGEQLLAQGGIIGGGLLGAKFGVSGGRNFGNEGAAIGTAIGSLVPIPGAGLIGGLLGGLIGGRFGKKKDDKSIEYAQAERIAANTRETVSAIENQTRVLLELDERLLNVPSTFTLPQYRPLSFGGNEARVENYNTFQIDARGIENPRELAREISRMIITQSGGQAQFVTIR